MGLRPQYVVDANGKRKGVLLAIKDYQELLERAQDLIDAELIDEAQTSDPVPWSIAKNKHQNRTRK